MMAKATEIEKSGRKLIRLDVGEPDFRPPKAVLDAVSNALYVLQDVLHGGAGDTRSWSPPLRRYLASADTTTERRPRTSSMVTPGGRFAVYSALATVASEGDSVVVIEPNWPAYKEGLEFIGARPITIRTTMEEGWEPSLERVQGGHQAQHQGDRPELPRQPDREDHGHGEVQGDSRDRGRPRAHRDQRRDLQRLRLQAVPHHPREAPQEVHPHVLVLQGLEHDWVQGGLLARPRGDELEDAQDTGPDDNVRPRVHPARGGEGARVRRRGLAQLEGDEGAHRRDQPRSWRR